MNRNDDTLPSTAVPSVPPGKQPEPQRRQTEAAAPRPRVRSLMAETTSRAVGSSTTSTPSFVSTARRAGIGSVHQHRTPALAQREINSNPIGPPP